jgi:hypothetical protein
MASEDARKAFWTLRLSPEWSDYLTMEDINGRHVRMPFGLSWAPRAYNNHIEDLFATKVEMRKWMEVMVDNFLLLGTADDIDGFLDRTITFYTLCVRHRIPLSPAPDKRSFCRATTDFYRHKLGYRGTIEPRRSACARYWTRTPSSRMPAQYATRLELLNGWHSSATRSRLRWTRSVTCSSQEWTSRQHTTESATTRAASRHRNEARAETAGGQDAACAHHP